MIGLNQFNYNIYGSYKQINLPKWCWQNEHYRINLLLVSLLPMLPVLQFASKFFELTTISCTLQQFPTLLAFVGSFPVSRFHLSFCYCCALRSVLPATARRAALCTALRRARGLLHGGASSTRSNGPTRVPSLSSQC